MYKSFIKRLFDFIISLSGFILLFPIFIILSVLLFIVNDGKPYFFQMRPGRNNKIFRIVKFKTMNDKRDSQGNFLPDKDRLTSVGKFVRKTSLDEIPQLINVIKGDMSLIGPRPLLVEYLPLYNEIQIRRHEVRPGITGWAQVNGRNAISWQEKFNLDVWYVDNISLILDIKIILKTFLAVIKQKNINQAGQSTVDYFKGN